MFPKYPVEAALGVFLAPHTPKTTPTKPLLWAKKPIGAIGKANKANRGGRRKPIKPIGRASRSQWSLSAEPGKANGANRNGQQKPTTKSRAGRALEARGVVLVDPRVLAISLIGFAWCGPLGLPGSSVVSLCGRLQEVQVQVRSSSSFKFNFKFVQVQVRVQVQAEVRSCSSFKFKFKFAQVQLDGAHRPQSTNSFKSYVSSNEANGQEIKSR